MQSGVDAQDLLTSICLLPATVFERKERTLRNEEFNQENIV